MKRAYFLKIVLILSVCFFIVRGWVILSAFEEAIINDELHAGVLTFQLFKAQLLPLYESWHVGIGGPAIYQILAVPFYLVFGDGLLSIKIMALLIGSAMLVLLFKIVLYCADKDTALWTALFFIFAPPSYIRFSIFSIGDYFISSFFTLLAAYLFSKILRGKQGSANRRDVFLLGMVIGFFIFFHFMGIITLFCIIFFFLPIHLLKRKNMGYLANGLTGFLIGGLPLIITLLFRGYERVFSIYGNKLWDYGVSNISGVINRIVNLFVRDFPGSLRFHSISWVPAGFMTWIWYGLAIIAVVVAVICNRHRLIILLKGILPADHRKAPKDAVTLEIFMLVFIIIFIASYIFSNLQIETWHDFGYRYLIAIYPAIFILLATGISRLAKKSRLLANLSGAMVIAPCVIALFWPLAIQNPLRILRYKGISLQGLAVNAVVAWKSDAGEKLRDSLVKMDKTLKPAFLIDFARAYSLKNSVRKALGLAAIYVSPEDRVHFYRGIRLALKNAGASDPKSLIDAIEQIAESRYRSLFYDWLLDAFIQRRPGLSILHSLDNQIRQEKSQEYKDFMLKAKGDNTARALRNNAQAALAPGRFIKIAKAGFPQDQREEFLVSIGMATQIYQDRSPYWLAFELKNALEDNEKIPICVGIGRGLAQSSKTHNDYLRWHIDWDRYLGPGCNAAFGRGFAEEFKKIYGTNEYIIN